MRGELANASWREVSITQRHSGTTVAFKHVQVFDIRCEVVLLHGYVLFLVEFYGSRYCLALANRLPSDDCIEK